jgi:hypothetical protein
MPGINRLLDFLPVFIFADIMLPELQIIDF